MYKNWQRILGIVLSVAWLVYIASISIHQHDSLTSFLASGFIPIVLCWGVWDMARKRMASTQPKEDYLHFTLVVCLIVAYGIAANYSPIFWVVVAVLLILDGARLAYKRKWETVNGEKLNPLGIAVIGLGVMLSIFLLLMWIE